MNIERLKQLEEFLEIDPNDPFILYAIAMEWIQENPEKTREYFDLLLKHHEEYIGTYYHAGKLYASLGKNEIADNIFKKGIIIADRIGDKHALRELKSAYNEFLFENEED